jgi:DnaJ-domain-containing protein 1
MLNRLFNVLRANLNAGRPGKVSAEPEYEQQERNQEQDRTQRQEQVNDPIKLKELEYLSNLELKEGATFDQIKASYKNLIRKYHPDKFHGNEQQRKVAEQVTSRLNEAFAYFEKSMS